MSVQPGEDKMFALLLHLLLLLLLVPLAIPLPEFFEALCGNDAYSCDSCIQGSLAACEFRIWCAHDSMCQEQFAMVRVNTTASTIAPHQERP